MGLEMKSQQFQEGKNVGEKIGKIYLKISTYYHVLA